MKGGGRRIALVVGNAEYSNVPSLSNPHNDARGIAAALTRMGFYGVYQSKDEFCADFQAPGVTPITDLPHRAFQQALAAFGQLSEGADQAVFYYAGHGIESDGQNYLIPTDATLSNGKYIDFESTSLLQVLKAIDGSESLRLIILDCCRANPFNERLFGSRSVQRGLGKVEPSRNILVSYSAKHGTLSLDGPAGGNSPYAMALMAHMETPGLEIVDLFREIREAVWISTNCQQDPYLYGSLSKKREFLVAPIAKALIKDSSCNSDVSNEEQIHWTAIQESTDPYTYERFIVNFPQGVNVPEAQLRSIRLIQKSIDLALLEKLLEQFPS